MQKKFFAQSRRLICLIISLFISFYVLGQEIYPIQVYTNLYPPYTPDINSLYSGTQEKLVLTLINTDMTRQVLPVRLRMKIVGTNFSLITPPEIFTPEVELSAGTPLRLSLSDLAAYFKKENLRPSSDPTAFFRTGRLPDGFYRFHFEAYDAQTNLLVSNVNAGFAQAWITTANPPVLNLPKKGEWVAETDIPMIFFSWMPMHNNSIYAVYHTAYEFALSEIYDKTIAPEAAFSYAPVLFREEVSQTSFLYTSAHPALIPGRRYAWRVRAITRDGFEPMNVFTNEGYSEVFWFDYTADCKPVQQTVAIAENNRIRLNWLETSASECTLEYRKTGALDWETETVSAGTHVLSKLQSGVEYEYRIASRCANNDDYVYSTIQSFQLPEKNSPGPNCGLLPDLSLLNKEKIKKLSPEDIVYAGDFPIKITKVSGSGTFTGEGSVMLPVLKSILAPVTFSGITVNTDKKLLTGYFETKYDQTGKNNTIWNIDQTFSGGGGVGDIRSGEEKASYTVKYDIDVSQQATIVMKNRSEPEDSISETDSYIMKKEENQYYVITYVDTKGKKHNLETPEVPATITDKSGNTYLVNESGDISPLYEQSKLKLNPKTQYLLRNDIAVMTFEKTPQTKYALDVYQDVYKKETLFFEEYKTTEEHSIASAKFMLPGKSDEVFVRLISSAEDFHPEKVRFLTGNGKEVFAGKFDDSRQGWILTMIGSESGDGQELFVVYEENKKQLATLARLRLYAYQPKDIKVRLVPVNGFSLDTKNISALLDDIYRSVGINCQIKVEDNFEDNVWDLDENGKLQVTGSGLFSRFTPEMKILNGNYTVSKGTDFEKDALYLFMLESSDSLQVTGDMPRGKQFGYLFSGAGGQTVAHEIAHGHFKLQHTFDYHFNKEDLPDNLMNSPGGTELSKFQWDAIHHPGIVIGLFEKDEDAMTVSYNNKKVYDFLEQLRLSFQHEKIVKTVGDMLISEKKGITINGIKYPSISLTFTKNTSYKFGNVEPNLFSEKNIYGKEVFCIGYSNNAIKIVVQTSQDRQNLVDFLHGKRANAFLLFVAGYRPQDEIMDFLNPNVDKKEDVNLWDKLVGFVQKNPTDSDLKDYWSDNLISDQMIVRLKPKKVTYMTGYDEIGTSNHRNENNFKLSYASWVRKYLRYSEKKLDTDDVQVIFNTIPNLSGFIQRRNNGRRLGREYVLELESLCLKDNNGEIKDTLDIVCHSMGFAHALGIIDAVRNAMNTSLKGITLGRFYIFAPENAHSGEVNIDEWQEVWQYGSDESKMQTHPLLQDGIAPQSAVKGIGDKRVFIPKEEKTQGFLGSHSIKNYDWIFSLPAGSKGYIKPR